MVNIRSLSKFASPECFYRNESETKVAYVL